MAAMTAIDHGRRCLVRTHYRMREQQQSQRQTLITDFFTPTTTPLPPLTAPQVAAAAAVDEFWGCLQNFAALPLSQQSEKREQRWKQHVPQDHPLLGVSDGSVVVNRPAAASN